MVGVVIVRRVSGKAECGALCLHHINVANHVVVIEDRAVPRRPGCTGVCNTIASHNRELVADVLAVEGRDGFYVLPPRIVGARISRTPINGSINVIG